LLKHCRTCETAEDVLARRQATYSRFHWIIQSNRLPDTMPMLS
jgi:hypothetical protein